MDTAKMFQRVNVAHVADEGADHNQIKHGQQTLFRGMQPEATLPGSSRRSSDTRPPNTICIAVAAKRCSSRLWRFAYAEPSDQPKQES